MAGISGRRGCFDIAPHPILPVIRPLPYSTTFHLATVAGPSSAPSAWTSSSAAVELLILP